MHSGFGGLEVACWRLVPKFAGSNPAEAVGFFRAKKILSAPSFGREVKPFVPCRRFTACKRSLNVTWKSGILRQNLPAISRPSSSSFHYQGIWWRHLAVQVGMTKKTRVCTISLRLQCIGGHQPPGPYYNTIQNKTFPLQQINVFFIQGSYNKKKYSTVLYKIQCWQIDINRHSENIIYTNLNNICLCGRK